MGGTIAEKYVRKIDKIMESSVDILFGIPRAIENASTEVVNTAIEMHNKLYEHNQEKKIPISLDIHIGINKKLVDFDLYIEYFYSIVGFKNQCESIFRI